MTELNITLIRHGQPTVSLAEWIPGQSLQAFIHRYNQAGISDISTPLEYAILAVQDTRKVFTSDYRRTIESAQRLHLRDLLSDAQFREVDCWVNYPWPFPMPVWVWLLLTRVLWPLNLIAAAETFQQAQSRAAQAALFLVDYAKIHQHIVLVGHGGFNTLISRELRALGWQGLKQPRLAHWSATSYRCPRESCL